MCKCTPEIRTPFCGKLDCEWPKEPGTRETTVFICGNPRDHVCDDDGPHLCGGEDEDGAFWQGLASIEENRRRATWGSVSCSKCGSTSIENSFWQDLP